MKDSASLRTAPPLGLLSDSAGSRSAREMSSLYDGIFPNGCLVLQDICWMWPPFLRHPQSIRFS